MKMASLKAISFWLSLTTLAKDRLLYWGLSQAVEGTNTTILNINNDALKEELQYVLIAGLGRDLESK